jgi:uncharacterized protein (TIGR00369 family)
MRKLNPDYVKMVSEEVSECPYFSLISMQIKEIGFENCRIEVAVQEKHLQPYGIVHGGVCASLVDATAFWAVFPHIDDGVGMTTVELKINYLAPISKGTIIGRGRSIKVGKKICLGEARLEDEKGSLLAYGTATMMVLDDLKLEGKFNQLPKFLE